MSVFFRVNVALVVVFALGALSAALICRTTLEANARRETLADLRVMMDSAVAVRAYTATEITPLLNSQMKTEFLPQSVPFYAATQSFLKLRESHPEYSYKEATLNPTNLRDRAADWEADIIQRFRNSPQAQEISGERDTPMGRSSFLARPIRADAECLECHSLPAAAPRAVTARYGTDHGFGWQPDEVIGAQVVSVPVAGTDASAAGVIRSLTTALLGVFAGLFLAVNLALYMLVVRPLRRAVAIADRLSTGELSAPEFAGSGGAEIVSLGRSFDRMRKSLDKALRLLEP
jgi:HAMP domain-containing protein